MLRWIMHVDMDAFFASVEQLDNPELKGLPVIVGGLGSRGVVSTCSYEARKYGVHSAMPMAQARKLCPQAVYLPGHMRRYKDVSREIMAVFHMTSPLVEQLSIDEAFLDLTGMEKIYGSAKAAGRLVKDEIRKRVGLTASVGLAPNKFLAKLASDLQKPDGFTVIRHEEAASFIAPLPVTKIFGIGAAAGRELSQYGIITIGQLAAADMAVLQHVFGKNAARVHQLACGIDDRPVVPESEPKSIGRETTFERDLHTMEECKEELLKLSGMAGYRLRSKGYYGRTVTLKVKYADFRTVTHSITGESDISCDEEIYELAARLMGSVPLNKGVRLLGVSISGLGSGQPVSLGFEEDNRRRKRNDAVDQLKKRFGEKIIFRGGRHS